MTQSKVVPGEGPPQADLVLVGEAPGATEEREGRPFCGSSGNLLDEMLDRAKVDRRTCYVTNVVKTRPPSNDFDLYYSDAKRKNPTQALVTQQRLLRQEIQAHRPKVVVCLGSEALKAVVGKYGITAWRGSILEVGTQGEPGYYRVIGTYHPAAILRQYSHRTIAELDLRRAKSELGHPPLPCRNFQTAPVFEQVMATLDWLRETKATVSFDIETTGEHVRCLGLGWSEIDALCIPFISHRPLLLPGERKTLDLGEGSLGSYWSEEEERAILARLSALFLDPEVRMIAQNFPFDATILEREFGLSCNALWMDTMVAQHTCYSELPKSLDFLCSIYTRRPRYSDYTVSSDHSTWTYNCYDCVVTWEVAQRLEEEMRDLGVLDFYHSHAQPTMVALCRASNRGILVDQGLRDQMGIEKTKELEGLKAQLAQVSGQDLNPNSPKQVKALLYGELKLPRQTSRKTKKVCVDDEALEKLARKHPKHKRLLGLILHCRQVRSFISTSLGATLTKEGRMVTSYHATGTVTGRISSRATLFGLGTNLQNVPRGPYRKCFIADPGKVLVKADLSQAEHMAVVWLARIGWMMKEYIAGRFDIHRWVAATIVHGKPESEVTKDERQVAKASVHGGNYGIGAKGSAAVSKLPFREAKDNLAKYHGLLPQLLIWWRSIENQLGKGRVLRTPLGRIRVFLDRLNAQTFRSAYAFLPQSMVGDQINQAFYLLDEGLPMGSEPLLQVHDEVVVQTDPPPSPTFWASVDLIREYLELPIQVPGVAEPLVIPADITWGPSWGEQSELPERT